MEVSQLGEKLKRLRVQSGLSVRQLALKAGKSAAYIGKIETRGEVPTAEFLCQLARVLNCEPKVLLHAAKESQLRKLEIDIERRHEIAIANQTKHSVHVNQRKTEGLKVPIVISLINMKGGVGKTTIAAQLAHAADKDDFRVLAIDLDPQSNLSQSLLGFKNYASHLRQKLPTVAQVFDDYVAPKGDSGAPRPIDLNDVIIKGAGYWSDSTLDLIPSRLELCRTLKNPTGKERRLAKALARLGDRYDLVIIDCAPTESILTDAAYFASRFVIVPVKPEFMATIGLPLLARSISEFRLENDDHELDIAGLAFNHSSVYSTGPEGRKSMKEVRELASEHQWNVFDNHVTYSASYAKAAREGTPLSQTSYAHGSVIKEFEKFKDEVFHTIKLARAKEAA